MAMTGQGGSRQSQNERLDWLLLSEARTKRNGGTGDRHQFRRRPAPLRWLPLRQSAATAMRRNANCSKADQQQLPAARFRCHDALHEIVRVGNKLVGALCT